MCPVLNFCPVCGYTFVRHRSSSKVPDPYLSAPRQPVMELEPNYPINLGAGRVDPFGVFPIAVQPYMHVLIDHSELPQKQHSLVRQLLYPGRGYVSFCHDHSLICLLRYRAIWFTICIASYQSSNTDYLKDRFHVRRF
jgi:hypothetical protein